MITAKKSALLPVDLYLTLPKIESESTKYRELKENQELLIMIMVATTLRIYSEVASSVVASFSWLILDLLS